jgi:hypothetical protein
MRATHPQEQPISSTDSSGPPHPYLRYAQVAFRGSVDRSADFAADLAQDRLRHSLRFVGQLGGVRAPTMEASVAGPTDDERVRPPPPGADQVHLIAALMRWSVIAPS